MVPRHAWQTLTLCCLALTLGCYRYTPREPHDDSYVRMTFTSPRDLSALSAESARVILPSVIEVEGQVSGISGDTLWLNLWRAVGADDVEMSVRGGATRTSVVAGEGVTLETRSLNASTTLLTAVLAILVFVAIRLPSLPSQ
jgi:hypothetical protein